MITPARAAAGQTSGHRAPAHYDGRMPHETDDIAAADYAAPPVLDTSVPHSARIWNYWLGGKDYFKADREAGDAFLTIYPSQQAKARECRRFLRRVVEHLTIEVGIRQLLDIGTGLPTADNTHEIAQRHIPDARIVYVDNDPLVLAHARALLISSPAGVTRYIHADIREPQRILDEAEQTLDLSQPVALILFGILGHVPTHAEACSLVEQLMAPLPPGSYLAVCDGTATNDAYLKANEQYEDETEGIPYRPRSQKQIAAYFAGLELVEPGIVPIHNWRPDPTMFGVASPVDESGGIGRKP
jgi:trans-aconitate methyltransferase